MVGRTDARSGHSCDLGSPGIPRVRKLAECSSQPLLPCCLALLLAVSSCHLPLAHTQAGTYKTTSVERHLTQWYGVAKQIALFLPNRIVDAFDIVKAGPLPVSIDLGIDLRVTRWGQLAANLGVGAGIQWDGRDHLPWNHAAAGTAAFGPWRTGFGAGRSARIGDWEIGLGFIAGKIVVDLAEILDFVLGWAYVDLLKDDYGWSP